MSFGSDIAADPREYAQWRRWEKQNAREAAGGFPKVPGVAPRLTFQTAEFEAAMKDLPHKVAEGILRKGVQAGLRIWLGAAKVRWGSHRSRYQRPHIADHLFMRSSIRRGYSGFSVYGAVGVRKDGTILREEKGKGKWRAYFNDLPGWRTHFPEGGINGRPGLQIFPSVLRENAQAMNAAVRMAITRELRRHSLA